jgi:hypothetical protein
MVMTMTDGAGVTFSVWIMVNICGIWPSLKKTKLKIEFQI